MQMVLVERLAGLEIIHDTTCERMKMKRLGPTFVDRHGKIRVRRLDTEHYSGRPTAALRNSRTWMLIRTRGQLANMYYSQ